MSKLVEIYNSHPYEPLVPTKSQDKQMVFKFNSPQHYLSYVENLQNNFPVGAKDSNASSTGDESFTLSKNMNDAYEVIRGTEFEPNDATSLESKVSQLKKGTEYSDDGYELEIAEHLAGSDRVWLRDRRKVQPTRLVDDILIIDAAYSAGRSAEKARKVGVAILESIYRRKVIPRKMVVAFAAVDMKRDGKPDKNSEYLTAIDVSFSDLHGIAKMLHPSSFRRLWFRIVEQYPDLSFGHGRCRSGTEAKTTKGYVCMDKLYNIFGDNAAFEAEMDVFLGVKK